MALLGAVSLAIGARLAYTSYVTEKILSKCLAGSTCPLNLNGLALQVAYSNAKGELLLGGGLAFFGILCLMYTFLFAGRREGPKLVEPDQN